VKLVIAEAGSTEMAGLGDDLEVLACANVGYAELPAAVAAAQRAGRLPGTAFTQAKRQLERVWSSTSPVVVDMAAVRRAGDLAEEHALRGYDAVHLAALQRLGPPSRVDRVACWDSELRRAAATLGYRLLPEHLAEPAADAPGE